MEKHIDSLNNSLFSSLSKGYPLGLAHGKMGLCIYLFHLSRESENPEYQTRAEELLDDILTHLSLKMPIQTEEGLSGIALGITYLVKESFVEGDLNEILEQMDHMICKKLLFDKYSGGLTISELIHLTFYLYIRLKEQTDKDEKYLFEQLIIKTINKIQTKITPAFFEEPIPFSIYDYHLPLFLWVSSKLLEADIYSERIKKIIEEIELFVLTTIPLLQINRLYLLWGIHSLYPFLCSQSWEKHSRLLYEQISIADMLENEMKNKNIFISNGIALIPLLLNGLQRQTPACTIECNYKDVYDRIIQSEAWNSLKEKEYYYNIHRGLLNGFPGVYLISIYLKKHYA